jgi:very-short-patch-repair endonuclease
VIILRAPRRKADSKWEEKLYAQILAAHLPPPAREFPFHPSRKWRADFVWLEHALIAEVEGAIFSKGRHTRGAGFSADTEKYNAAVLLGWRVLRFTEIQIRNATAVETIRGALAWRGELPMFARW